MYDNIKAKKHVSLIESNELERIKTVFCCSTTTKNGGFNNSDTFKNSSFGVYVSFDSSFLHISFSLHKFYNSFCGLGRLNCNSFSRVQAGLSLEFFSTLLDLSGFVVVAYECGFNFCTTLCPSLYFRELDYLTYGNRHIRIIENPHYKEFLSFSSHSDKDKRAIYVFYDKYEQTGRICQKNLVRVEKKYRRVSIPFLQLFEKSFLDSCYLDIYDTFTNKLCYKKYASLNKSNHYVHSFVIMGLSEAFDLLHIMRQNNELTALQYFRLKKSITDFDLSKVLYFERPVSLEFRSLIVAALSIL